MGLVYFWAGFRSGVPFFFQKGSEPRGVPKIRHNLPTVSIVSVGTKYNLQQNIDIILKHRRLKLHNINKKQARGMMKKVQGLSYAECLALKSFGFINLFAETIKIAR